MCGCLNPNLCDHVNGGVDIGEKNLLSKIHEESNCADQTDPAET